MNDWLNEWMNEWMVDWMNEWMNGWLNEWMNGWLNEWMNVAIGCPIEGKSLLIEGKLIKGSRVEQVRMIN